MNTNMEHQLNDIDGTEPKSLEHDLSHHHSVKGKAHPGTGHEGTEGGKGIALFFL